MFSFLKPRSLPGWLALVAGESRIDVAHVERREGALPRVTMADSFAAEGGLPAMLKALKGRLGLTRYRCTTLLAHGQYQLVPSDPPEGPREEWSDLLRWQLKDQVGFEVDSAAVDVIDIPAEGRAAKVFAAMAAEADVAPVVHAWQEAGVPLAAIDLPEFAQRNLAALAEDDDRGLALLMFGDYDGLLTFSYHGELHQVRHIDLGFKELAVADADRRAAAFDRVSLDVQRSLDNFDRAQSHIPLSGLMIGPLPPDVAGFLDFMAGNLLVRVESLDLAKLLDLSATPALLDPLRQAQCARALGAALRT